MSLRDLRPFRRVVTELFGSGLHVLPPSDRPRRHNAEKFADPVMGVTARTIQPISERFRTRPLTCLRPISASDFFFPQREAPAETGAQEEQEG